VLGRAGSGSARRVTPRLRPEVVAAREEDDETKPTSCSPRCTATHSPRCTATLCHGGPIPRDNRVVHVTDPSRYGDAPGPFAVPVSASVRWRIRSTMGSAAAWAFWTRPLLRTSPIRLRICS
jgi:hypothetical protein